MTDVTDNFNRANGLITTSSNWLSPPVSSGVVCGIVSNQLVGSGAIIPAYWNPAVNLFANDQYAQATCVLTGSGFGTGLALRILPGAIANDYSGYLCWAGRGQYYIFRLDHGGANVLTSNTSGTDYGDGRVARFEITGSALTLKINGNVVLTATDATYPNGQPGILPYQSGDVMDDWLGGPVFAPAALPFPFNVGVNYPWNAFGADFGTGGFGYLANFPLVESDFITFAEQGVKVVRWWLMADGRYCPVFNPNGTTAGLNNGFLADINRALAICASTGVYVIFSIMDNLMFNNAQDLGSGVIGGGHAGIVTNSTLMMSFLNNALKPLLQQVNMSPNKQWVWAWEIVNEPEAQIAGGYNGFDFFRGPAQFALSDMQAWVRQVAAFIHTWCPGTPVTVGSAIPVWTPLWIGLGLDFHQAHYYDFMDAGGGAGSGMKPVASITADDGVTHLDAPCLLGEFASTGGTYGLNDTSVFSARWYMDQSRARGYSGAIVWSKNSGDSASNWPAFQPVFTNWVQNVNPGIVGPLPPLPTPMPPPSAQPPPLFPSVINKSAQYQKDVVPYITDVITHRK